MKELQLYGQPFIAVKLLSQNQYLDVARLNIACTRSELIELNRKFVGELCSYTEQITKMKNLNLDNSNILNIDFQGVRIKIIIE